MKKYVFAGASQRALKMFCKPMLADYQDVVKVCGVYDINYGRAKTFVTESGADFPAYEDFDTMLAIAAMYHTSVSNLLSLNPQIKNPSLIYPGDAIRVH